MSTEDFKRKLTAILSADVQGYSRLMGEDEDSTVRILTAYRALMSSLIQSHRGHVVDTPGDNLLAKFDSGTDAVRCAVEIQEELRIRNAELPENRKMQFRIGINLGDVIEEGSIIYGDGINVAARIEGLADGGGICISGFVYGIIKNKLSLSYEFMGEHSVKNIKDPVRVYRIRMEPDDVTPKVSAGKDVEEAPNTIAVLPFIDLSPEKDQEYFVLGLSEEILNSLCQIPDLTVIARTSSFSFKGTNKKIQDIAVELGVAHILEGSVRKASSSLRITAQLIKGIDGSHLWSKTYNRELKDIFEVQEDIANAVACELKATFGIEGPRRRSGGTDNVEAYELYLNALGHQHEATYDVYIRGLESLDAAISLDPEFANAWATKAFFHAFLSIIGPSKNSALEQNESLRAARKAIELEPNLAAGHFQMGWVKTLTGDWIEAEQAYRRALELTTDPFSYEVAPYPLHYFALGYFEKSEGLIEKFLQKNSYHQAMRAFYMLNLYILGDTQGAEKEFQRSMAMFNDDWFWGIALSIFTRFGTSDVVTPEDIPDILIYDQIFSIVKERLESPEEALEELRRSYGGSENLSCWDLILIAFWAAYFGYSEFAMEVLEKSLRIAANHFMLAYVPAMHEVRQLPRFKEFVREIGLVDYWDEFGWPDLCRPNDNGDFVCD